MSDAVRVFFTPIVAEQQFSFALTVPNADTQAARQEARALDRGRLATADALIDERENVTES
ncbi:MAG: hypothetical protein EOP13_14135 [Pseudomonas sp.]|nr:MAG: hypothetical protein EOP13_14135 [Pseudomonas sp.]